VTPIIKKKILVTVKAYPNPSRKYGETTCCAGVDLSDFQLIRLYPIPFRDLDNNQKFKKYSVINVECSRPKNDSRPESFHVNSDSIEVIEFLDTEKGTWKKRKDIVLKVPAKSLCQINKEAKNTNLSLGLIKPEDVTFEWAKQSLSDVKIREACYAQLSLFNKQKEPIEKIPLDFYYKFRCSGVSDCPSHKLSIIDWELRQSYREWRRRYSNEQMLLDMIEKKWLDISNTTKKDVYFYVGNMNRFRTTFMILGVFYPTRS
jgi:hypothetical protein